MSTPSLIKNYVAEAALTRYRLVCWGATDGTVKPAAASTDKIIGVAEGFGAAIGDRVDVVRDGIADVEYGGVVTRGDPLTADASGRAIAATPAAAANARIVGYAEVSGVAGDIGSVAVNPETIQG